MGNFARVFPFVWPYRRKVLLSILFALVVAIFWGLNLSVAFPVVKVLLQGQSLTDYASQEEEAAQKIIDENVAKIAALDERLRILDENPSPKNTEKKVGLLKKRARKLSETTGASRQLLIVGWLSSYIFPWLPPDQFDMLVMILGVLFIATVLKGICIFIQGVLVGSVVELTIMGIRKKCFRQVLTLDYQTLSNRGTSDLMSRFTFDLTVLAQGLTLLGGKVIREPLKAGTCVFLAFLVNWQLTLLSLLFVPLVGVIFYRFGRKLKHASHRMMESMSRIYKTLEETLDAIKIVIAFNGGQRHRRRFHHESKEYYAKAMRIVRIDALTSPTTEVLGMLAAFAALLPGAYLVLRDTRSIWSITLTSTPMDVAELSLLYVLLAGVLDPVRKLSTTYAKVKRSAAAADRIFSLIDEQSLVKQPKKTKALPRHAETIEFKGIHFAYTGREDNETARRDVLEDVNLTVNCGEVIVVVGENGSGKSTLVNLLPRFFDPNRGSVLIDGIDIRDTKLSDLRSQIGVVTQETLLFDETIAENIGYGKPAATKFEIEKAGKQAHVTTFVEQLPDGFETQVGEKGQKLSGGQRQRISLARAMLRDPAILILDEATSAIDAQSELLIHEALRSFVKDRTTFIITHSVSQSILDFVTRIVVMDQGRLIAVGTHDELIASCPTYQNLYRAHTQQRSA